MSHDAVNGQVDPTVVDARVGHVGTRIDLDDLTKRYRVGDVDVTALDGINLHVDEAAFVAIVGPSGCGKTTLLNMIGALDTPTSGSVRVAGVDVSGASQADRSMLRRHSVSFIFQTFNLFPALTALENVRFGADAARTRDPAERAQAALAQVGWRIANITSRTNCRAASSNAWRSRARWRPAIRSCSLTNRPASSTSARASKFSVCSRNRPAPG